MDPEVEKGSIGYILKKESSVYCNENFDCTLKTVTATGTATRIFWDNEFYWLTAGHVCAPLTSKNELMMESELSVVVLGENEKTVVENPIYKLDPDLCLIKAEKGKSKTIENKRLRYTQDLYSIAFPGGVYSKDIFPKYEGKYMGAINETLCATSIPVAPGSSGAGVTNEFGKIVGVISSVMRNFNHFSIFVCPSSVVEFVEEASLIYKLQNSTDDQKVLSK